MASKSVAATKTIPVKAVNGKAKATPGANETPADKETPDAPDGPLPLLDLSDAAVKKMIKGAKKRGYVTYEQLNAVMPSEEVTSEQIEDMLAMLNEMGINVVETEEAERGRGGGARGGRGGTRERIRRTGRGPRRRSPAKSEAKEPAERTDDPVRMYLREMGSVELLSREGEIAIAKRIEAGREAMIAGLCESPLTFQAIIIWRDELNEGKVFLRDIIDLEATYAGPDAKAMPGAPVPGVDAPPAAPAGATPFVVAAVRTAAARGAAVRAAWRDAVQAAPGKRRWRGEEAARKPPKATPISTRTISRTRCRSPRSRPSSSPRCWRPSTTSPTPSSGCAACRTRTSRTS